jgi:autotransporter-associated beta strand protein
MSSNLHPINGGRVLAPGRFISAGNLLKRQFLKSVFIAFIACFGIGMNVWGQQNVFSRDNSGTGDWGSGNLPWYYQTSNNNQGDPDNGNTTRNDVFIGHNNNTTMSLNGRYYQHRDFTFQSAASTARTLNNTTNGGFSFSRSLKNGSTATHTFNAPIGIDGNNAEIILDNASGGGLTFNGNIFTNSFQTFIRYGNGNTGLITFSGAMTQGGSFVKQGGGVLLFNNNADFSGSIFIDEGTLRIARNFTTNSIEIGGGVQGTTALSATLEVSSNINIAKNITVRNFGSGSGSRSINFTHSSGVATLSGTLALEKNITINNTNSNGGATLSGGISGVGGILKTGTGTLGLSGANTYTGSTTISGGTIQLNRTGGTTIPVNNDLTVNNSGTLRISTNQSLKNLTVASGGTVTVDPDVVLTVTGDFTNNGTISGTGKIVMGGSSAQTISGTGIISNLEVNNSAGVTMSSGSDVQTITGNLTNNGTISGAGKIVMGGSSAQTISGTGTITNLDINNSTGVSISSGGNMQSITGVLTPAAGILTTNGNLTLKSSATGTARVATASGGTISGDVTVERYFKVDKRAWRMVTAPVSGNSNNSIFYNWQYNGTNGSGVEIWGPSGTGSAGNGLAVGPNASMRYWNNSTGAFENVTNTKEVNLPTPLFSASGNPLSHFLFVSGAYGSGNIPSGTPGSNGVTIKAVGSLRQGDQTFSIPTAVGSQFYMVGNPYASPVNLGSSGVAMTNVNNSIWLWDPNLSGAYGVGGYVSFNRTLNEYNITGSYLNSPEYTRLQSGQAFFVQATANGALSVNFTESTKGGNDNGNVFRNTNEFVSEKLRVTLQRNFSTDYITTDGAVAVFHAGGTKEIDEMDGVKMMNAANNLMFRRNGTNLTFEHRPLVQDDDTLFLNLRSTSAGAYRLLLQGSDFDKRRNLEAFLQDAYLDREEALKLDTTVSYDFTVDANATSSGERFRIVFRKKAIPPPVEIGTDFSVYPNPIRSSENLSVKFRNREAGKYTVAIYNVQGIQVQQQVLLHGGSSSVHNIALNAGLPAGTYLVQVLDGSAKKIDAIKINVQ